MSGWLDYFRLDTLVREEPSPEGLTWGQARVAGIWIFSPAP